MLKQLVLATAMLAAGTATVDAAPIEFTGTSGSRSAKATFEVVGSNLVVTLSNVGGDALLPIDVLTGVFFQLAGTPSLTRVSALLAPGSQVLTGTTSVSVPGGNVSGEWAYKSGLAGPEAGVTYGISSSGLGLFGPGDVFPGGTNLSGPAEPDGLQYGIVSSSDNGSTGNAPVTGTPLIKNKVVFTLDHGGSIASLSAAAIQQVFFQYGTATTEPRFSGSCSGNCAPGGAVETPAPASLAVLGGALIALGGLRRRRG